ncbi:MAG TPA: hypothetical protein VI700_01700, partial [Thermoanaerobaculaceae bacterium]|nr:hypothetical protein [Thermoanaerobaculaceae bacterium]
MTAAAILLASAAMAQFQQYIAPGSLGVELIPTKERLDTAMEEAPFRLGPLRLGLWFALQNVNWVNNVYGTAIDQKSDFTATASLGLHGYLPAGPKLVFALYALPEYVWWNDLTYLRGWNGKYGVGVFGYFNRVTLELQAADWRTQQFYSTENPIPVDLKRQRGAAALEVEVLGRLSVFGTAWENRWRYEGQAESAVPADVLQLSDRNEKSVGGGLRYRFSKSFAFAIGYEELTTDFLYDTRNRSSSGDGRFVELELRGNRLWATARATVLTLRPQGNSQFAALDTTTGRVQIGWKPGGKLEFQAYGGRNISYPLLALQSYYTDQRWGVGLQLPLGWRSTGRIFWEQGRDEYPRVTGESMERIDDSNGYGVGLNVKLGKGSAVGLEGSRT